MSRFFVTHEEQDAYERGRQDGRGGRHYDYSCDRYPDHDTPCYAYKQGFDDGERRRREIREEERAQEEAQEQYYYEQMRQQQEEEQAALDEYCASQQGEPKPSEAPCDTQS